MYKIELLSVPKLMFCCSVAVDNYKNVFKRNKNFLELTVIESGRISAIEKGKERIIQPHTLLVLTSDTECRLSATGNERQCHTTVGVSAEYKLTKCSPEEIKLHDLETKENVLFLPEMKALDDKTYNSLILKIKKIASNYYSFKKSSKLSAISAWYDLCSEITDMTLSEFGNNRYSPSAVLYSERICKYVSEHLNRRISLSDMSESLGISEGYMQNTFKRVTGKSIVEYANEYKILTAAEMMRVKRIKLKDMAQILGIDDPAYMSRLFRKVMGVSFAEYRKKMFSIEKTD